MGGVEPYSFLWQDGTMDTSLLMQTAGTYGLTITDSVSCSIALSLTIDEPDSLQIDFNSINPACPNDSTGSVQATINGGMPPFSVLWSTGDTTSQISNIPPGNYSISVTDSNNCTASQNTFLDYLDDIAPIMELKDISVYLNENGITEVIETEDFIDSLGDNCGGQVTVSFLAAAYSCEDLDSLFTIPVIAIDEQGNSTEDSFQLTVVDTLPPEIICMPDVTINGCAPFEYDLPEASDNCEISSINLVSGLGSGSVFPIGETEEVYIVTDQSGNTATCSFTVLATGDLNVTIEIFNESCREACDGEAIITILGGTPPYSIDPEILFDLCPGDYIVTITDAAGCSTNVSFTIQEAPDFEITNIEAQDASSTADDGFIDITVEGGTEPLSYSWTKDGQPFSTEEDISGLAPGLYACVVTDANGCIVFTDEIIINMETFINNLALDDQVKIFPNPASDLIIIEYEFDASAILDIQVKGMDGKRFIALQNPASENIVLNISDVPEGLYMIHLNTAVGHFVKRVLIVR
jgi:hypothetical protein